MSEYRLPIKFALTLFLLLAVIFIVHLYVLHTIEENLFDNLIVPAYCINFLLAVIIFFGLFFYRYKLQNAIGFLFMGGSFIKFIIFFLIFYPTYKDDGNMERLESAAFFIPYLTALVLETYYASKMLNGLENPKV